MQLLFSAGHYTFLNYISNSEEFVYYVANLRKIFAVNAASKCCSCVMAVTVLIVNLTRLYFKKTKLFWIDKHSDHLLLLRLMSTKKDDTFSSFPWLLLLL